MKVSTQLILLVLFLLTISAIPAVAAPEAATDGESAICYRGGSGFLISPPPGWVNLRNAATQFGVCLLFAQGCRSARRDIYRPDSRNGGIGFRLALSPGQ